jgi:ribonuclease HI
VKLKTPRSDARPRANDEIQRLIRMPTTSHGEEESSVAHYMLAYMSPHWLLACLVLYFDGSLRTPRDAGFPTHRLGRMASCGAALYNDDDDDDNLLTLGGKLLEIIPDMTSADVEYEGLLFGLNHCVNISPDTSLIVRGDCKAIIDQLNGDSVPRKLRPKHELVLKLLERMQKVSFEHVPRDENKVCDAICAAITNIVEQRQLSTFRHELATLATQSTQQETTKNTPQHSLADLVNRFVSSEKSLVRFSMRPVLYEEVASVADRLSDGMALEYIGKQLQLESKLWPVEGDMTRELMAARGISLHVQGLQLLGREKDSKWLLRKHRYLLGRYVSQDVIAETFVAACHSEMKDSVDDSAFVVYNEHGNESEVLQTWYDQATQQDESILHQGYWITR